MNWFLIYMGIKMVGIKRAAILMLCVSCAVVSCILCVSLIQDFRSAVLISASGSRPHLTITFKMMSWSDAIKIAGQIQNSSHLIKSLSPSLRLTGKSQIEVRNGDDELTYDGSAHIEVVAYPFNPGVPAPVELKSVYSEGNRNQDIGESPVEIIEQTFSNDNHRVIISENFQSRIFRRPMPHGNAFTFTLPKKNNSDKEKPIKFHARTAGTIITSPLTFGEDHNDVIYVRTDDIQRDLGLENVCNSIDVLLFSASDAVKVAKEVKSMNLSVNSILTWEESEKESISVIYLLDYGIALTALMVGAMVTACLSAIFYMVIADRLRRIAILSALGMNRRMICYSFASIAVGIGLAGSILGIIMGNIVANISGRHIADIMSHLYQRTPEFIQIPTVMYFLIPLSITAMSCIAMIIPISLAVRVNPANLLHSE